MQFWRFGVPHQTPHGDDQAGRRGEPDDRERPPIPGQAAEDDWEHLWRDVGGEG
jgi:hypothetical protein